MEKLIILNLVFLLNGCAFYQKEYVSDIEIKGKSYPGGDEGSFYIDNDPLIKISMGCYKSTTLGFTVFPILPIPDLNESDPHDTLAAEQFYFTLGHFPSSKIDLSELKANVEISDKIFSLSLLEKDQTFSSYINYKYVADLRCSDIKNGILRI